MFSKKDIRRGKRALRKKRIMKALYYTGGTVRDIFWGVVIIALAPLIYIWALVKAVLTLGLHSLYGIVGGFSIIRGVLFILSLGTGCVFNGWIPGNLGALWNIEEIVKTINVFGYNVKCGWIAFFFAAIMLIINSIYFMIDQLTIYEVADAFSSSTGVITDLLEMTFWYKQVFEKEELETFYGFKITRTKPSAEGILPRPVVVKKNEVLETNEKESENEKKKKAEIEAYAEVFGECFWYDDIAALYKQLYEKYHPETGTEPNKEKFEYMLLGFEGALNWVVGDKDKLLNEIK